MPISSDLSNPRNFITKISKYQKVLHLCKFCVLIVGMLAKPFIDTCRW